jgi:hypothetical protein
MDTSPPRCPTWLSDIVAVGTHLKWTGGHELGLRGWSWPGGEGAEWGDFRPVNLKVRPTRGYTTCQLPSLNPFS